ncbi:putative amino-acid metabolite efflux pump [mine drainage metagenome]|uniref:Putative amino-acid metabolite efflux pump n=1 Tax=mine drainage metagenome TaxID=410659 RepID=A0A1J5S6D9_9ZZZZ
MNSSPNKNLFIGFVFAMITIIIWSGNYVVARGIANQIPPVSLAFFRWGTASVFIALIGWKKFIAQKNILLQHKWYLFFTALTGVTIFNTLIYVAGHFTAAINLVLIATTAAPIFITVFSAIFLKERINNFRLTGIVLCFAGVLLLLSQGSWQKLMQLRFGKGDLWILASAFIFSIYSVLVKKKPATIAPMSFLVTIFIAGTLMLFPFYIIETQITQPLHWTHGMLLTILYLGIGNSVIGFLCWNASIARIGPARTSLFSNLMPVFSTIEAVLFLNEKFTTVHLISGIVVIVGLIIANLKH